VTIVVTVKVSDGIVIAADSAASFFAPGARSPVKIYNNANKIFNLVKVWPVGAMMYGSGSIGGVSVETLTKDLRELFSFRDDPVYGLKKEAFTIEEVAIKARKFMYEQNYVTAYQEKPPDDYFLGYRVCGYSSGSSLSEVWEFAIAENKCDAPHQVQPREVFGIRWAGENEVLDRLLLGASGSLRAVLVERGMAAEDAEATYLDMIRQANIGMTLPSMPIQDAIDLARFLVETAARFARYGLRPETIGGPTEIAAITKHEGFKWVARKHYYSADLNRETEHGR
jgi:hypothetical protein